MENKKPLFATWRIVRHDPGACKVHPRDQSYCYSVQHRYLGFLWWKQKCCGLSMPVALDELRKLSDVPKLRSEVVFTK